MRGGSKSPAKEEQDTINFAFASVVSIKPIEKGDIFTEENLWVKRPGNGEILAIDYKRILGKKSLSSIKVDTQIKKIDIEDF